MATIEKYMEDGLLKKQPFTSWIVDGFMNQARKNLQIMNLLDGAQKDAGTREKFSLPKDVDTNDWVIITGYYGMYMAAQAALAKIGYVSKSHAATIAALDTFYVKKKLIDEKYLGFLKKAEVEKEHVQQLKIARGHRETAQYDPGAPALEKIARELKENSYQFVNKIDEILSQ